MTRALFAVGLCAIWVLAWGSPSPANVLGGLVVAVVLLAITPGVAPPGGALRIRPAALARLGGHLLVKVVESNVLLTRQVLARRPRLRTGVVEVPLPDCSDGLLTFVTNVMALTPGTMPLEVTRNPTRVFVHVLQLDDPEDTRREIQHLAALAYRAFGSESAAAAATALEQEGAA